MPPLRHDIKRFVYHLRTNGLREALAKTVKHLSFWTRHLFGTYYLVPLKLVLMILSVFVPRKPNLWVFTSAYGFAENSKYAYLYVVHNEPSIEAVWLSRGREAIQSLNDAGYRAYHALGPTGLWAQLQAKVLFKTHNRSLRPNRGAWYHDSVEVLLDDGLPIVETKKGRPLYYREKLEHTIDYFVLTGRDRPVTIYETLDSYCYNDASKIIAGFPRADALTTEIKGETLLMADDDLDMIRDWPKSTSVIAYLPTYRMTGVENPLFSSEQNIEIVDRHLQATNRHLVIKPHPKATIESSEAIEAADAVTLLDSSVDPYPLCRACDAYITDYSSMMVDLLLTGKPLVFFSYDREEFFNDRPPMFAYDEITPGPKAYDIDQLLAAVDEVLEDDGYERHRERLKQEFHEHTEGRAAERITEYVKSGL